MPLQSKIMTVLVCIGFAVSLAIFAAICGVALLVLAGVRRVWSSKLLQTQANPRSDHMNKNIDDRAICQGCGQSTLCSTVAGHQMCGQCWQAGATARYALAS